MTTVLQTRRTMKPRRTALIIASLCTLLFSACTRSEPSVQPVLVGAASDLAWAFQELGPLFTEETGIPIDFTMGSTGLIAHQIKNGAPFDVFAAANVSFVEQVVTSGDCDGETQTLYARGRIVVLPYGEQEVESIDDLADERFGRIAIANPNHAPYGAAAKQALESRGLWESVQDRLVIGENISQAFQFVESGNADVAIVALSLIRKPGREVLVPAEFHQPIDQALAVCLHGDQTEGGRSFVTFLATPEARQIMESYGFQLPAADGGLPE